MCFCRRRKGREENNGGEGKYGNLFLKSRGDTYDDRMEVGGGKEKEKELWSE